VVLTHLQCAIPVVDGLLPEPYNTIIINLLFELATWHAFGKLRMHTEMTLYHFDNCTTRLGQDIRKFSRDCCAKFNTYDLPRETAARARRRGAKNAKAGTTSDVASTSEGRKRCTFNMSTYKLHALGDYVKAIWEFGTTDNYSTQVVSIFKLSLNWLSFPDLHVMTGRVGTPVGQTLLLKDE